MFGAFNFPHVNYQQFNAGVRLGPVSVVPGGGLFHFVRSTGPSDYDPPELTGRIHATLNAALGQCRSGKFDHVFVLPGHTENISTADQMSNLVAGTQIIGIGIGTERPTFTWTATGSTFLLDVANVSLQNCILNMDPGTGSVNVTAPMTISAAGCSLIGNQIRMGTDANSKVTIGITTTAAADDLLMLGNDIYGAAAAECTTMIQFVGADRLRFIGNKVRGATSSVAVGVVRFLTTASTDIQMYDNTLEHKKAASETALTGMAGISGQIDYLHLNVLSNAAATLVIGGANSSFLLPGNVQCGANVFVTNTIAETAAKMTPVSA